ncbi:MAG: hypothetical protein WCI72_01210 [archaeon]
MKLKTKLWFLAGVILLILLVFFAFGDVIFTGKAIAEEKSMVAFVNCLNEKGVLLYGFADHPQVKAQLDLFGNSSKELNIIDCHFSPEKCNGVIVFPSWRIDNRVVPSGFSLGMLAELSGCRLQ